MRDPDQALAAARAAAQRAAADPGPADRAPADPDQGEWAFSPDLASTRRLAEWAIIEPEAAEVYSTRAYGRPITWLKRLLVRLLAQYLGQISAQQSRFNAHLAAHVIRLEERVTALEQAARERDSEPPRG